MFSNLEIEPIEDNIEHEDSFDALESHWLSCDWPFLVIWLLVLSFVLFYILGLDCGIFQWKFEKIYYQLSNKRGCASKREVDWIFGTLMKAENFKIENLEKLLDEMKMKKL